MKRKLLFATALFTSTAASAGTIQPILQVDKVVTNGKGPSCTLVENAPEDVQPVVVNAETDLPVEVASWDGSTLCVHGSRGPMQRTVTVRFFGEEPETASVEAVEEATPEVEAEEEPKRRRGRDRKDRS